jgi:HMG (high mobility group) box
VAKEDDDTVKPTRACSAYIYFSNETIPKLKAEQGVAHKDAMSKAGELWHTLTEEQKKPFNKKHDDDVLR